MIALLALIAALIVLLWAFTAFETRRIEERFPPIGTAVAVGGGAIRVADVPVRGEERGVVLLIHGTSETSADMTVALAERLSAQGFRVLSADRPGHGWSDRVAIVPSRQAEMLRLAAVELGCKRAIVVTHSLGSVTALAMALNSPAFIRALVLISPVSHPWPGGVTWYYPLGAHPVLGPPFRNLVTLPLGMVYMRKAVAGVFAPNDAPPDFIRAVRLPLVLRPLNFLFNCQDVVGTYATVEALSPDYREIDAPTEIVTGDCDGVVDPLIHAAGCKRDIPGAWLTTLPHVGHAAHHVAPDAIVERILEADRRARGFEAGTPLSRLG